jgi:hypothetical protein
MFLQITPPNYVRNYWKIVKYLDGLERKVFKGLPFTSWNTGFVEKDGPNEDTIREYEWHSKPNGIISHIAIALGHPKYEVEGQSVYWFIQQKTNWTLEELSKVATTAEKPNQKTVNPKETALYIYDTYLKSLEENNEN